MTRLLVSLLAAAALSGVSACGAIGTDASARSQSVAAAPAPVAGPVHFVQRTDVGLIERTAGARGVLTLDAQGCFRLGEGGPVLVWPAHAALDLTQPGVAQVFHRVQGGSVRVGDRVSLGGGEFSEHRSASLSRPLGPCTGPAFGVDSFGPSRA